MVPVRTTLHALHVFFISDELRMSSCCRACVVAVVLSAFRCPEVGLEFGIPCVQRFDYNFFFEVSRGRIRILHPRCPEVELEFSLLGVRWAFRASVGLVLDFVLFEWCSKSCPLGNQLLKLFVHPVNAFRVFIRLGFLLPVSDS